MAPPKSKKSPLDLALSALLVARNRARSSWSFSPPAKRTYNELLLSVGYKQGECDYIYTPEELARQTTIEDVNELFAAAEARTRLELGASDDSVSRPILTAGDREAWMHYFGLASAFECPKVAETETTSLCHYEPPPQKQDQEGPRWWEAFYSPTAPLQKAVLHPKQIQAAGEIVGGIRGRDRRGLTLLAPTGVGKTYVLGSVLRNLFDSGFFADYAAPYPVLYITKAPIVIQTERVLMEAFGLDPIEQIKVINIEQLRAYLGTNFVVKKTKFVNGEPHDYYVWHKFLVPRVVIVDECQIIKNDTAEQSKILQALNRHTATPVYQIFSSATPFTRVCEARCFCCATRVRHDYGVAHNIELTDEHWTDFARQVAAPADPEEYNGAAISRLMDRMDDYIVRMKNVRPKFHAHNGVQGIRFQTQQEHEDYAKAWEEFQEEKRRIEGDDSLSVSQGRFQMLAQFTVFRKKAEKIKVPHYVNAILSSVEAKTAPGIAACFKGTITGIVRSLIMDHGWKRSDISIIWGGSMESLSKKKKLAKRLASMPELLEALKSEDIDLASFGLDFDPSDYMEKSEEDIAWERAHDMISQNQKQRQNEIDRFQQGLSKCVLFTFKSGGAGLSLHHEHLHCLPRVGFLTPTYSAMELVQGLGRLPRLTSLSDTSQTMLYYIGTIEEQVAQRVSQKLRCLSRVVRQRESWESVIVGERYATKQEQQEIENEQANDAQAGTYIEDSPDEDSAGT